MVHVYHISTIRGTYWVSLALYFMVVSTLDVFDK